MKQEDKSVSASAGTSRAKHGKLTSVLVLLFLLAAIAAVYWIAQKNIKPPKTQDTIADQTEQKNQVASIGVSVEQLDSAKLPDLLPADLPWETGAEILQNYNATNSETGQRQATRVYVTKKSLKENLAIFKKYLADNGWQLRPELDQESIKAVSGAKGNDYLDAVFSLNTINNQKTVSVSFTVLVK